jgi:F0F1-type ATP synthase epsilon subunit
MTCSEPTGDERGFYLAGGFAQMRGDKLVVLPDQCVPVEELSPEDAWDELSEARKLPRETAEQERLREDAIATARIKFRVAQKHHGRRRPDTADTTDEWD